MTNIFIQESRKRNGICDKSPLHYGYFNVTVESKTNDQIYYQYSFLAVVVPVDSVLTGCSVPCYKLEAAVGRDVHSSTIQSKVKIEDGVKFEGKE